MEQARPLYFHPVVSSIFLLSFFFSSPNLSGQRLDVYYRLLPHPAARGSLKIQDAKITQKSPPGHHRTNLSGYIFATKARIDNRKNLLSSNIFSTVSYNMVNFGILAAGIVSLVWGTPANFNGFRVLAALQHGTPVLGVSQT